MAFMSSLTALISIHAPHARSDSTRQGMSASISISIHAPHARSDTVPSSSRCVTTAFQSTLLMRGATSRQATSSTSSKKFQSTLLMRGATAAASADIAGTIFQSTLLMRGATCRSCLAGTCRKKISIHAPHARSDWQQWKSAAAYADISIHAPHARSDSTHISTRSTSRIFQSTLLMRGATSKQSRESMLLTDFNPRSSCEERPSRQISTSQKPNFNPRSSCEERHGKRKERKDYTMISIHAPHARSDKRPASPLQSQQSNFNPRSSCEERLPKKEK